MRPANTLPLLLLVGACGDGYDKILALQGDPEKGRFLYEGQCADCHGNEGEGITGPALTERIPLMTSTEILEQIDQGGVDMPAFQGQFDDQELADLLEYLTLTFQ